MQGVLGRLANDYRRTVAYYGNIEARPGFNATPRRLLSDVGFPTTSQFTYLVPSRAHVIVNEDARAITRLTFCPYGLAEDRRIILSPDEADRRVRTSSESGATGLRVCPLDPAYLVSSELNDETVSEQKTVRLIRRIVSTAGGPAYHVIINRRGDVIVAAALDDTTRAAGDNAEISVDIAVESALSITQEAHVARRFDSLIELPFTTTQIAAIVTVIAKLTAAYPAIARALVPSETSGPGVAYRWPITTPDATPRNFSRGAWRGTSPYDHALCDAPRIFEQVAERRAFDLTTEVFRSADAPEARTGRAEAQTAVSQADSAGEESALLGAYSIVAGEERASEMQGTRRIQLFVQRIHMAHHDANQTHEVAGAAATASSHAAPTPPQNILPHVFDFTTGYWGDGKSY